MDKELEERTRILLDEANQLFNRLEANISYLGRKISSFFGILLSLISIQITLIMLILNYGAHFSVYSYILLIAFSIVMTISVVLSICLLRPKSFKDVEMFKKERFERLTTCGKEALLSDLLYHTKKCYEHDYDLYNTSCHYLIWLYYSFLIGNLLYILLIMSMWL